MSTNRTLRILAVQQYFYPDGFGGIERVAYETLRRLADRGHRIDMVGQRMHEGSPDQEKLYGVTAHRYGNWGSRGRLGGRTRDALIGSRPVFARVLNERTFDLVLAHHWLPYYAYQKVAGRKVAPEIMTYHASFWQELKLEGPDRRVGRPFDSILFGNLVRRSEAACLKRADSVVVLSDFSREQLASCHPFATRKVVKIPGGVDLERFRPPDDRARIRKELNLPLDSPVLFTARRLVPRMGLENILAGFAQVEKSSEPLLVIAGRGRLEGQLAQLADELRIGGAVRFVGYVDDAELVKYYQAADLFVLPTLAFEGFGMVTLEALSCGTPAIGTPIGATPELLRPLAPQLLFDGTEPAAIRRGIQIMIEWLSDGDAARRLRARARVYVEESYGWDSVIDALEALFERMLGAEARSG